MRNKYSILLILNRYNTIKMQNDYMIIDFIQDIPIKDTPSNIIRWDLFEPTNKSRMKHLLISLHYSIKKILKSNYNNIFNNVILNLTNNKKIELLILMIIKYHDNFREKIRCIYHYDEIPKYFVDKINIPEENKLLIISNNDKLYFGKIILSNTIKNYHFQTNNIYPLEFEKFIIISPYNNNNNPNTINIDKTFFNNINDEFMIKLFYIINKIIYI